VSDDDFLRVEAHDCPMSTCAAPAGSPCRTGKGKVAVQYHTARFRLVPHLAKASVPVPALRKPGSVWVELPRPAAAGAEQAGHVRIGYARASTVRQSLDTQMDSQSWPPLSLRARVRAAELGADPRCQRPCRPGPGGGGQGQRPASGGLPWRRRPR
jgi:hypothetical protein